MRYGFRPMRRLLSEDEDWVWGVVVVEEGVERGRRGGGEGGEGCVLRLFGDPRLPDSFSHPIRVVQVREAELYSQFDHNNLLSIYDYTVVRSKAVDGAKEVVMLMPLFRSGSLFDQLVTMEEAGNRYSETEALALFISICSGPAVAAILLSCRAVCRGLFVVSWIVCAR